MNYPTKETGLAHRVVRHRKNWGFNEGFWEAETSRTAAVWRTRQGRPACFVKGRPGSCAGEFPHISDWKRGAEERWVWLSCGCSSLRRIRSPFPRCCRLQAPRCLRSFCSFSGGSSEAASRRALGTTIGIRFGPLSSSSFGKCISTRGKRMGFQRVGWLDPSHTVLFGPLVCLACLTIFQRSSFCVRFWDTRDTWFSCRWIPC